MAQTGPPPVCKAPLGARCRPRVSLAADGYVRRTFLDAVTTGPRWLDEPLAADAGDAGCGLAFEQLGRYGGAQCHPAQRAGTQAGFRGVAAYLRGCRACHEDLAVLLVTIAAQEPL